jgi:hypothetical protein
VLWRVVERAYARAMCRGCTRCEPTPADRLRAAGGPERFADAAEELPANDRELTASAR